MIKRLLLLLIRFYRRFISPMHAPCCPFTPTCSTYAMQAVERHGALYGGYLAIRRLLEKIEGSAEVTQDILEPELVIRSTCRRI